MPVSHVPLSHRFSGMLLPKPRFARAPQTPTPPRIPPHSWGPVVEETPTRRKQKLYLSEQTDGSEANKLLVALADVARPRTASAEHLAAWGDGQRSPCVSAKPLKVIIHPGEVNKVRGARREAPPGQDSAGAASSGDPRCTSRSPEPTRAATRAIP